ncbi:MAG: OmpA family protein [candidate division Zixibacteria bacterium]|nr:OmpA family protein [candidate division Zixibacteria bacterium]
MADEEKKDQPIIIIKKYVKGGGHHGGAWKVAFADFMTAMFAFFLVMWIVGQSDEVKNAVQGYFQDPVGYTKAVKMGLLKGGQGVLQGTPPGKGEGKDKLSLEERMKLEMEQLATRIRQAIDEMPGLNVLRDHMELEVTREGLRVQLIEGSSDVSFFKPGSSTLSLKGELILKTIAMEMNKLSNQLVIEGHTDASDYSRNEDYTNWELSADRANAARRAMETKLNPNQVYHVRGYADKKPRFIDNPSDPRNRRITILVLNRQIGKDASEDSYRAPIIMSKDNE